MNKFIKLVFYSISLTMASILIKFVKFPIILFSFRTPMNSKQTTKNQQHLPPAQPRQTMPVEMNFTKQAFPSFGL